MRVVRTLMMLAAVTACATKTPPVAPPAVIAPPAIDVAALVRRGCFRCLEEAMTAATGDQAFEVAALLTLRAKELGLPYRAYLERATALAAGNPAYDVYLEILNAARVDPLSGERYRAADPAAIPATRTTAPARRAPADVRAQGWRDALAVAPGSPMLRGYVRLTVDCMAGAAANATPPAAEAIVPDADAPLLRYRAGLCDHPDDLRAFRDGNEEFVDADYMLGRVALQGRVPDLDEALRRIEVAAAAFPDSLAIATVLGDTHEAREEWADALAAFDGVIARMPEHREALLGRTVALSRLGRHEAAAAAATAMIDLGSWFLGEAYYWRAWNEFQLQQHAMARADADRAKSLMVNASVFVLSGLIEWSERRLPTAEGELVEALKMDFGRCDAARYLGLVRVQRAERPEAIAAFKQAIQCFDLAMSVRQKLIAEIQAGTASPAAKARQVAAHERAIATSSEDREECVQNLAALQAPPGPT